MGVTLKLATSLDGRIATASGESRWITGEAARQQAHRLRAEHDAVVVGIETALADDPELTVRLEGFEGKQPARVVLDGRQRLSPGSRLARMADQIPTYVVTRGPSLSEPLRAAGVRMVPHDASGADTPDPGFVVVRLAAEGLNRLLLEGGGRVAASFLDAGQVQRIEWFRAPIILGSEGRPAVAELHLAALADARRLRRISVEPLGEDIWERYEVV